MNDVRSYLKVYEDFLPVDYCKTVVDKLNKLVWDKHAFYNSKTGEHLSYENELSISYADELEETKQIQDKIWYAIERYILKDHVHMNRWFANWNGYTKVRFNRYVTDTNMKLHCDHIRSMFDGARKGVPILSIVGALNDDYEGGDLVFWDSEKISLKAGQIMVFPSNFMYPHEVKSVTKGVRYSYVSWVW